MSIVRSVLGDIDPARLGRVNYHEQMFQVSPLLPGDELDDEVRSGEEAGYLRDSGFESFIDATPCGLGRRPAALARIARRTGMNVIMTTGAHKREHYAAQDSLTLSTVEELGRLFLADLTWGFPSSSTDPTANGDPVRAGILKVGVGYWAIDEFARRVIEAVGAAHAATGAPVMVHLDGGSAAHEVLDRLADVGVRPTASSWPTSTGIQIQRCILNSRDGAPIWATTEPLVTITGRTACSSRAWRTS